jgi:glycosyltransferase involved in cell wall biosynthesis
VLKRDDVDLYHGPANFLPPRKPCPFVLTLHDMVYFHNPGRTFPLRAWYWQWSIRSTWQLADLILTVSHFSRRQIQKYISVPDRLIRVIPNGVDRRFFEPASDSRRAAMREICHLPNPYILYVGRLDPDKNVRRLIRAYALLVKAGRCDADLAIAGIPEFQVSDLPALIDRLGIADRVQFLGFVPEENLVALYQEAAAFCFPSLNEGFGLPVLEAMAAGVPVVTSNISSLPEVAGDACVLVDPFSPREIARGLAQALRPRMARELSEAGRERASEFTWERAAAATADAYDEVLSPTAQSRGRRR